MPQERESRLQTREQRAKEREARRILLEEELANLSEEGKKLDAGEARISERQLKANEEKRKQALEELGEEDWVFDCAGCGKYGENYVRCLILTEYLTVADSTLGRRHKHHCLR